jgi:hypothetical protein
LAHTCFYLGLQKFNSSFKNSFEAKHQWFTPIILATWEADIERIKVQGQPRQIVHKTPISKISTAKWTGSLAQVVERLLCKHEDLNSTPVPPK